MAPQTESVVAAVVDADGVNTEDVVTVAKSYAASDTVVSEVSNNCSAIDYAAIPVNVTSSAIALAKIGSAEAATAPVVVFVCC